MKISERLKPTGTILPLDQVATPAGETPNVQQNPETPEQLGSTETDETNETRPSPQYNAAGSIENEEGFGKEVNKIV